MAGSLWAGFFCVNATTAQGRVPARNTRPLPVPIRTMR
ncbi:hypothetical protein C4K00_2734 [Pseudomonas synxantha]|nr:hypothetical protein C4K00_2734 [Pseudomonas synxantha]